MSRAADTQEQPKVVVERGIGIDNAEKLPRNNNELYTQAVLKFIKEGSGDVNSNTVLMGMMAAALAGNPYVPESVLADLKGRIEAEQDQSFGSQVRRTGEMPIRIKHIAWVGGGLVLLCALGSGVSKFIYPINIPGFGFFGLKGAAEVEEAVTRSRRAA